MQEVFTTDLALMSNGNPNEKLKYSSWFREKMWTLQRAGNIHKNLGNWNREETFVESARSRLLINVAEALIDGTKHSSNLNWLLVHLIKYKNRLV